MGLVKHSQSSQNSKFAISFQYVKKEVKDEVDFLHANKQSFLKVYFNTLGIKVSFKVDIIIINGHDQAFFLFFNWDSLHARLNSHYEAWS